MGDFIKAARISDIPEGQGGVFTVGGTDVAIFNIEGKVHAIQNACCHRQGPLGEGDCEGTTVTCPWHAWKYDVTTGECLSRPGANVRRYQVRVEGDDIFVETS